MEAVFFDVVFGHNFGGHGGTFLSRGLSLLNALLTQPIISNTDLICSADILIGSVSLKLVAENTYNDQFNLQYLHISEFYGLGMSTLKCLYQHYGFFLQTLTSGGNVVQNENFDSLLYIKQVKEVTISDTKRLR